MKSSVNVKPMTPIPRYTKRNDNGTIEAVFIFGYDGDVYAFPYVPQEVQGLTNI